MRYIVEYKNIWPESFEKIAQSLREELSAVCRVHHVGSTSVTGMPAKDIIDIDIECSVGSMRAVIDALSELGYEHEGDKGITGREAFRAMPGSPAENLPPHHLYACEESAFELRKHIAFGDFLNAHRDRALRLAEQKRLADSRARTRGEYIQNKIQAYSAITAESLEWTAGPERAWQKFISHETES